MEKFPFEQSRTRRPYGETVRKLGEVAIAGYMAGGRQRKLGWWQKLAAFLKRILKFS